MDQSCMTVFVPCFWNRSDYLLSLHWLHLGIIWGALRSADGWIHPQRVYLVVLGIWCLKKPSLGDFHILPRLKTMGHGTEVESKV